METISSLHTAEPVNETTLLMIENIEMQLPKEEVGVLTESGRINAVGREIAAHIYSDFLNKSDGSYKRVLEMCKEAEYLIDVDDADSRDIEILRIIQSVRGKAVYNAHKTWVMETMSLENGSISASELMARAAQLKKEHHVDVYERAETIERDHAVVRERIAHKALEVQEANDSILEKDLAALDTVSPETKHNVLTALKSKMTSSLGKVFNRGAKRRVTSAVLAGMAVAYLLTQSASAVLPSKQRRADFTGNKPNKQLVDKTKEVEPFYQDDLSLHNYFYELGEDVADDVPTAIYKAPVLPATKPSASVPISPSAIVPDIPETPVAPSIDTIIPDSETPLTPANPSRAEIAGVVPANYDADTEESATDLARSLDFLSSEWEHPSNMCGPLSIDVYNRINRTNYNVGDFWLATPEMLRSLFGDSTEYFEFNSSVSTFDFDEFKLKEGDFLYLEGGDYDHMLAVHRVDELGRVFAYSNINTENGFIVQELLLWDPQNPASSMFREYGQPGTYHGTTGQTNFYVFRAFPTV